MSYLQQFISPCFREYGVYGKNKWLRIRFIYLALGCTRDTLRYRELQWEL